MQPRAALNVLGGGAEGAAADTCILIDRAVDLVTPWCLQLTYEGLVDETLHITNGVVQVETAGAQRCSINQSITLFQPIAGCVQGALGPCLSGNPYPGPS